MKRLVALMVVLWISAGAQAAVVPYEFTITGTVTDSTGNSFGLSDNDTIEATGTFMADLGAIGNETGTVSFDGVNGNVLNILVGNTTYTQDDDGSGDGASITFSNGDLEITNGVDFVADDFSFNSLGDLFDDGALMFGFWDLNVDLVVVPVPAAVWLFGSALAFLGWMRRKIS